MGAFGSTVLIPALYQLDLLCSSLTWLVSESAWAAIIKYHILCDFKLQIFIFSHSWRLMSLKVPSVLVLVRSLFLTWRWPPSCCVFSHSLSQILHGRKREHLWLSLPPRRTPVLLDSNPALKTTVNLNHLLIDLISKYSSIRDYSFNIWILKDKTI